jgi:hypothetical protein
LATRADTLAGDDNPRIAGGVFRPRQPAVPRWPDCDRRGSTIIDGDRMQRVLLKDLRKYDVNRVEFTREGEVGCIIEDNLVDTKVLEEVDLHFVKCTVNPEENFV